MLHVNKRKSGKVLRWQRQEENNSIYYKHCKSKDKVHFAYYDILSAQHSALQIVGIL